MSLLAELQRRNVIRMAGLYVVGAWLVVQVAATLLPILGAPAWVVRAVVLLLAIGFIPVLIFSWIYELTPAGLKRDAEVPPEQSIAGTTGRRIDRAIILVLLLALGFFAVDRFVFAPERLEQARADVQQVALAPDRAGRSIVVLPFVDMSPSKDQEYLSDGMAEELLNLLARIPELRVISRSSAFSFKGKAVDVATIAKQLDVAHVLEGSVRKAENQVRITVQLIDARTDAHLWSETYDRPLENIFAIQDEIAAAVVAQLKITLLGEAPKAAATDPAAYALYLQGLAQYRIGSAESYLVASDMLQQAVAISPDYAQAWALLGDTYLNQAARGMRPVQEAFRLAREAVNHALAIDPDLAQATASLAWIANSYDRDVAATVRHTERALALDPGNLGVLLIASFTARSLGRLDQAEVLMRRVIALDPANPSPHAQLGKVLAFSGRDEEAIASFRKAVELSPAFAGVRHWHSLVLLRGRDRAKAEQALALAEDEPSESYRLGIQAMAYHALGRKAESDAALTKLHASYESGASYNIAYAHAFRGEPDLAFASLEKALQHNDGGLVEVIRQPMFAPLHADPRWLPFLRKFGRAPEQLAAIEFNVTLPP